jgi:hypothetical protein
MITAICMMRVRALGMGFAAAFYRGSAAKPREF